MLQQQQTGFYKIRPDTQRNHVPSFDYL